MHGLLSKETLQSLNNLFRSSVLWVVFCICNMIPSFGATEVNSRSHSETMWIKCVYEIAKNTLKHKKENHQIQRVQGQAFGDRTLQINIIYDNLGIVLQQIRN